MRNQIILFLALLLPAAVSAQIPSMTANTLIKLQKDNVTWLARLDSLSVFLNNSSAGGIYGNGTAGSGNNTLPPGGSTITIPGQWQPLNLNMTVTDDQVVTGIRATTNYSSELAYSKYLVGKAPADSLELYSYDNASYIKGAGGDLYLTSDNHVVMIADSIQIPSIPNRTIATHLVGQNASGYLRRIQGASTGQILKWNGTDWALAADDTGGGGGAFTDLTDAPTSYTGQSGKVVAVKGTEDGLEFLDAAFGGGAANARYKNAALGTTLTTTETRYDTIRITPSHVGAKIVVSYSIDYVKDAGTTAREVLTRIRRGDTNSDPQVGNDNYVRSQAVATTIFNASNTYIDAPGTTSEVVYSLRANTIAGAAAITRHRFTAFELATAGPAGADGAPGPAGGTSSIIDENTALPRRDSIRFIGDGITATDANGTRTEVTLDPDLNALSNVATTGIMVRTGANTYATRSLSTVSSISGLTYAWNNADGTGGNPGFNVNIGQFPWKHYADLVATTNITLSGNQTIDGVLTTNNMRILVTGQTDPSQNGAYQAWSASWARLSDLDLGSGELDAGVIIPVRLGTTHANSVWQLTTAPPITVGTTNLTFTKILPASGGGGSPSVITPATITATQDNYAPSGWSTATLVRLSGDSGFQKITGFAAGTAGEIKTLSNVGSFCVYLAPEHASSTAANRISYQEEVVIWPGSSCQIVYDNVISRWMVLLSPSPAYDVPRKTKYHDAGVARVSTAVSMDEDWDLWGSVTLLAADPSASVPFNSWDMNSGSTASGGSGVMYPHDAGGGAQVGLSHIVAKTHVRTPANLSDDTNNYYYFMRLAASPYSGFWDQNNSVGLYYRHSANSGKWFFRSRSSGGTNTEVDTGVTFAVDTEYEIQVSLNAAGNEATAWIDGVVVGRITTNLPTSTSVGWSQQLEKTAGTSARSVKIFRFIGAAVRP